MKPHPHCQHMYCIVSANHGIQVVKCVRTLVLVMQSRVSVIAVVQDFGKNFIFCCFEYAILIAYGDNVMKAGTALSICYENQYTVVIVSVHN